MSAVGRRAALVAALAAATSGVREGGEGEALAVAQQAQRDAAEALRVAH